MLDNSKLYEEICYICFQNYDEKDVVPKILPCCKDTFCSSCLKECFKKQEKCPKCRRVRSFHSVLDLKTNQNFLRKIKCPSCESLVLKKHLVLNKYQHGKLGCEICAFDKSISLEELLKVIHKSFPNNHSLDFLTFSELILSDTLRKVEKFVNQFTTELKNQLMQSIKKRLLYTLYSYEESYYSLENFFNLNHSFEKIMDNENDMKFIDEFTKYFIANVGKIYNDYHTIEKLQNLGNSFELDINVSSIINNVVSKINNDLDQFLDFKKNLTDISSTKQEPDNIKTLYEVSLLNDSKVKSNLDNQFESEVILDEHENSILENYTTVEMYINKKKANNIYKGKSYQNLYTPLDETYLISTKSKKLVNL
jgi:hypothetical protein